MYWFLFDRRLYQERIKYQIYADVGIFPDESGKYVLNTFLVLFSILSMKSLLNAKFIKSMIFYYNSSPKGWTSEGEVIHSCYDVAVGVFWHRHSYLAFHVVGSDLYSYLVHNSQQILFTRNPVSISLLQIINRNIRAIFEICPKLTIRTPDECQ